MMKSMAIVALLLALGAPGAWAAGGPFPPALTDGTFGPAGSVTPNSKTNEFEIYNAVNQLLDTSFTGNAQIDSLEFTGNTSTWVQGNNAGYAVIGLGASAANSLEVYDASSPNVLINPLGEGFSGNGPTGNGTINSPYPGTGAVFTPGTQFGFDLNQKLNGNVTDWRSGPSLSSDNMDHMLVYDLSSLDGQQIFIEDPNTGTESEVTLQHPYLLAFEDLSLAGNGANSDMDYNDLMVLVDGSLPVAPVPEPAGLWLITAGLSALALLRRAYKPLDLTGQRHG